MVETTGQEVATKVSKLSDHQDQDPQLAKLAAKHTVDNPDPSYVNAVKAKLSKGLQGDDQLGQAGSDNVYKGKSLELGKGGRAAMMEDRISMELVNKGFTLDHAQAIANKQMKVWAMKKYTPEQIKAWQK